MGIVGMIRNVSGNHLGSALAFLFFSIFLSACSLDLYLESRYSMLSSSQSKISLSSNVVEENKTMAVNIEPMDVTGARFSDVDVSAFEFEVTGGTSVGSFGPVLPNGDGTYSSIFTGTTAGTAIDAVVKYKGQVFAEAFQITVISVAPAAFNIFFVEVGMGNAILAWQDSTLAESYTIKYGTAPGSYTTTVSTSATSPYMMTGLTPGTQYYFKVSAKNSTAEVDAVSPVSGTATTSITGTYVASTGLTSASTGNCPSSGSTTWCRGGTFASGSGGLVGGSGIALDPVRGYFYTAETNGQRVSKFNLLTGAYVGSIGKVSSSTGTCPSSGLATTWCKGGAFAAGSEDGAFNNPRGVTIDTVNGYIYVSEQSNPRVQRFDLDGHFQGALGRTSSSTGTCPSSGFTAAWCSGGVFVSANLDGSMNNTYGGIVADPVGNKLYVADVVRHRVQRFALDTGAFMGGIGRVNGTSVGTCPNSGATNAWCTGGVFASGGSDGMFSGIYALALDTTNGFLFVAEQNNNRVQKINLSTGASQGAIGKVTATGAGTCPASGIANGWCTTGTFTSGNVDGALSGLRGVIADPSSDSLYVADYNNNRVSKFVLSSGIFVGSIGNVSASTGTCPASGATSSWCTGGTFTGVTTDGGFYNPVAVAFDSVHKYLFVLEQTGNRINLIR